MKYIDEYRDGKLAQNIVENIRHAALSGKSSPPNTYRFMEFCGGHTHAISRYGISDLLPQNVQMIHGPGCPVCVLPIGRIDMAIRLALQEKVSLFAYGDCLRVPASNGLSLLKAKAAAKENGGEIRMVYSISDALKYAQENPQKNVVFLAIGFETTTPPTAVAILQAKKLQLKNFSVLCCHVLTPAAISSILDSPEVRELGTVKIDGFIGPAHVSTVIGYRPYEFFAEEYRKPVVIAGFEPLDVLQAILMLINQVNENRAEVENEFTRAVSRDGNIKAQEIVSEVFMFRESFEWRGLGSVPYSALKIRDEFSEFDAENRFAISYQVVADNKACECGAILRGVKSPQDCKIFGNVCTPENPIGSCMVSSEGACAAYYSYGRHRMSD